MAAYRKRRGRTSRGPAILTGIAIGLVLLALGGGALWLFAPRARNAGLASARAPEGQVKGYAVQLGAGPYTRDSLSQWAADTADEAAALGMNALFFSIDGPGGVVFETKHAKRSTALSDGDTFFHKLDALHTLCEAAAQKGLAVYAVAQQANAENATYRDTVLADIRQRYATAGIAVPMAANGAQGPFSIYSTPQGTLAAVTPESVAQAGEFFLLTTSADFGGAVFTQAAVSAAPGDAAVLLSAMDGRTPPTLLGYTPPASLGVTYPNDGASIDTKTCFVMGTSDPAQPLTLNGEEVPRYGTKGLFGVLVTLDEGENELVFANGAASLTWHITGPAPKTGQGGGTGGKPPHDSTASVPEGTFVQTTGLITSLLYDPSGDGNISETARRGAIAQVAACAETVRNGKTTWAYQLTSGDWVLAYNVQEVEGGTASFTGAQAVCSGRDELLQFSGSGTPLAYTNQIENTLSLRFYGAEFAADFAVSGSSLVRRCEVKPFEGGTELVLHFDAPLWGHVISYEGNTVQVVLKAAPTRSTEPNKPLAGVKVLLDAGHGDTDTGAMGAGGQNAPLEKDANLAVAKAAQYRLEQLGATVEMIRTDDTFLSLEQRNAKITELRPDFFIAVHHNSVLLNNDANQSSGTECYYFYDSGKALAETLVAQVTASTRRPSRGAMWGYYYVTRNTLCPAVLLETGFMPNPAEFETVTDETSMWAAGDAIARSVLACVT